MGSVLAYLGLVALRHMGSYFLNQDQPASPALQGDSNHWTIRDALMKVLLQLKASYLIRVVDLISSVREVGIGSWHHHSYLHPL